MSVAAERMGAPSDYSLRLGATAESDRRADLDAKQTRVADLLHAVGCDGLLVLDPHNFAWLTSGAVARGVLDPEAQPGLYFSAEGRWIVCSNVDTQRLFDEEVDGLGFQLKEWPWHWGRAQLLTDLLQGRKVACDVPLGSCTPVAERLGALRRALTPYEQACYRALGQILVHALEATCRTFSPGDTEREVAGQLSHRLLHRGATVALLQVSADGRSRTYRQAEFTSAPVRNHCVVVAAARKYGLYALASRSMTFGPPETSFRKEHDTACRVLATYNASTWPDAVPRQILATGRRVYQVCGAEHEWLLCPQGHITGRAPVEQALLPTTDVLLQAGWALAWQASVGAALACDTYLVGEQGPQTITTTEHWPLKRIRVQGAEFVCPDLLIR
jgi:Xaa-Pro aminopeptidase